MSDPDVVAELEAWLHRDAPWLEIPWPYNDPTYTARLILTPPMEVFQRARDEIVALRLLHEARETAAKGAMYDLAELKRVVERGYGMIRAEALEEAAQVLDGFSQTSYIADAMAVAAERIRTLKDRGDE